MGMKDWLDKIKKKAEDVTKEETDPAKIKQQKKEAAEKTFKRTTSAIKLAKKGLEDYNDDSKKAGDHRRRRREHRGTGRKSQADRRENRQRHRESRRSRQRRV